MNDEVLCTVLLWGLIRKARVREEQYVAPYAAHSGQKVVFIVLTAIVDPTALILVIALIVFGALASLIVGVCLSEPE